MKIALIYPPSCDPTAPYLAVPMLTGFLRANGIEVLPVDANIEFYDRTLRPGPLADAAARVTTRLDALESQAQLDHTEQRHYLQLRRALADAARVAGDVAEARAILKDEARFFDPASYDFAVETLDAALRVVSAAYTPLDLSFTGYRTPFALTTPDEIAYDADPARQPFEAYLHELAARLTAQKVDALGLSVCFPGQLLPAYIFATRLKALLPGVHITCGGPGVTQLFIRLRGPDLARALGPFDSAVVFEGENSLLGLCRALDAKTPLRSLPNVVVRDRLLGARYLAGEGSEDLRLLPAPDFDGLPLDLYLSPYVTLPYDPTRGCYWGTCTFCHYGLAEVGTASYRERGAERVVDHLAALQQKYGARYFYLSQDSVAPKTLLKIAEKIAERGLDIRWATDLKPERYLTAERARVLKAGGGVACALGVESAAPRVLALIDKGAPVETVRSTIHHLADAGLAVEAMCFTDFPTESYREARSTVDFLAELSDDVALYIIGEFDLTHGALVAKDPARFGLAETYQLDGDLLGTGLFYEESRPSKSAAEHGRLDGALDRLAQGWRLRRYPWAGSLSTAHSVYYYDRFGPGIFRQLSQTELATVIPPSSPAPAPRFDLDEVAASDEHEAAIWHRLVRVDRHVSRVAYDELAAQLAPVQPCTPGAASKRGAKRREKPGRRPPNAANSAG